MTVSSRSFLRRIVSTSAIVATFALLQASAFGADGPAIPGVERLYEDAANLSDEARIEGGDLLVQELNCVACHQAEGPYREALSPRSAPNLDAVGARVRPEWLRAYLAAPHEIKPGAVMPDLFAGVDAAAKNDEIEALVHFLASKGTLTHGSPIPSGIARGEQLFHRVGCVACHDPINPDKQLAHSVPLPTLLSEKYTITSMIEFLKNPHAARPSGRMPSLNLGEAEARDVASYLLRDLKVASNLTVEIYKGSFQNLEQLRRAKAEAVVPAFGFSLEIAGAKDNFGLRFDGQIQIEKAGKYEFSIASDDGSALWIDGKEVAAVDGIHPKSEKKATVELTAGVHPISVEYFEYAGGEELELFVKGPGIERTPLDAILYIEEIEPEPEGDTPPFVLDPALATKGAAVFAKRNCVACHAAKDPMGKDLRASDEAVRASATAPKLFDLKAEGGCLSPTPKAGVPNYDLRPEQRILIATALSTAKARADRRPEGEAAVHRTLVALNCYACHQRQEIGGVETDRLEWFLTDQPEMGDEGRVPPLLTGTGDKLKPEWLKEVLEKGSKERPYMMTRMPKFGSAALGDLAERLVALDQKSLVEPPAIALRPAQIQAIGRHLVGGNALSCIKCHTFSDKPATGIQAISLTTMHKRLREDWFERYLLDPQQYRPGTRMPAPWPNGQSFYPDLLDGDTRQQIAAVWKYLEDGRSAAVPLGLETDAIVLVPKKRPILYRNFIEGAGTRAIAVGYPERANLAFDAEGMALRMIWQNAFIDASKHWVGRGPGFQGPLGDAVLRFEPGAPAARLASSDAAWPSEPPESIGWKFVGYRLNEQGQPTFLYRSPDATFRDFPQPHADDAFPTLERTIEIDNAAKAGELTFRALRSARIEPAGEGAYRIDDAWTLEVDAPTKPTVRDSQGKQELLVPIPPGESSIVLHYRW